MPDVDELDDLIYRAPARQDPQLDPRGLLSPHMAAFVVELASDLYEVRDVLEKYDIATDQFVELSKNKTFLRMLQEARTRFQSIGNTADRIKIKASLIAEIHLETMSDLIGDDSILPAARVSAYRAVTALTGLEKPEAAPPGTRFELKIILPGQEPLQVIEGDLQPVGEDE